MARSVIYVAIMKDQNTQIDVYTIINLYTVQKTEVIGTCMLL